MQIRYRPATGRWFFAAGLRKENPDHEILNELILFWRISFPWDSFGSLDEIGVCQVESVCNGADDLLRLHHVDSFLRLSVALTPDLTDPQAKLGHPNNHA